MTALPPPEAKIKEDHALGEAGTPVKITIRETGAQVETEKKDLYWLGTTPDSPFQNVTAGVRFPKFMGALSHTGDGEPVIPPTLGSIVRLSDTEVEFVKGRVALMFARSRGRGAFLVSKTSKRFRPLPEDRPLAQYLYMVKLADRLPFNWRAATPEPMLAKE